MNSSARVFARALPWLFPFALAALLTGCATQRIDWSARVGSYTYDQAVLELGPPDRWAQLRDETVVADWLTSRGFTYVHSPWGFGYPYWSGPFYSSVYPVWTTSSPDYYLRLIFGPDGKLKTWKEFAR